MTFKGFSTQLLHPPLPHPLCSPIPFAPPSPLLPFAPLCPPSPPIPFAPLQNLQRSVVVRIGIWGFDNLELVGKRIVGHKKHLVVKKPQWSQHPIVFSRFLDNPTLLPKAGDDVVDCLSHS
ncbi:hypothetical protein MiSe_95190 [Microseira wollei NIES-4236]|uniref:Uncharacterized protein n=1 Tax=Microseira wollei NIES-4236 TaxID=2530354 RepID=A0AAV3XSD3_9CYAN|nr:hypothetical protein MiSe_95190 [Microseira wollei NIES-4236]